VKLAAQRLSFSCPLALPRRQLRPWLLEQLRDQGEPLRWAITAVSSEPSSNEASATSLRVEVEAVLIR